MAPRKRVIVLFGGPSVEREVSRISARTIVHALDPEKYEAISIGVDADGRFLPAEASRRLIAKEGPARFTDIASPKGALILAEVAPGRADVVFPILHGTGGEDGVLQGFLETLGLPYVGSGVGASAVGMDKAVFKAVLRDAGIPTPRTIVLQRREWEARAASAADRAARAFGLPLFVKPANGGSSVGVSKVHIWDELQPAVEKALSYEDKILIEEGIDAREIECAVLGNDTPRASVPGEVVPGHEFYDYEDKYVDDKAKLLIPAPLAPETAEQVRDLAVRAFRACGCAGMARVDFFVEKGSNRVLVNELNTLPGFTAISMYPKLWEASGLSLAELLDELVRLALERAEKRKSDVRRRIPPKELS
jgi:D-alanine-D-alanine ligase